MKSVHGLKLAAALAVIAAGELLVPALAQGATQQISVCVTKFEIQLVGTQYGQRYRAVTTFSGHPTFNYFSFTPGGPALQGMGQMAFDAFTHWRDFYEIIRAAAQAKVKLAITYDDASTVRPISRIGAQFDQPC